MPASTYRGHFAHVPVASASGDLTGGTLVVQEGFIGVVITGVKSGKSTQLDCEGVHNIPVPSGTVKGEFLYSSITATADATSVTLTRTATSGYRVIGKALSDRDANGKALVRLLGNNGTLAP